MPITITKVKATTAPEVIETVSSLEPSEMSDENLADAYGSLEDQIAVLMDSPLFAQFKEVQEALAIRLSEYEPADEIKVKGKRWLLSVGPCSKEARKVLDIAGVAKMMGTEAFFKIAKVTASDADKYLTPEQSAKIFSTPGYTKNRKIKSAFLG